MASKISALLAVTTLVALSACSVIPKPTPDATRYYVLGATNTEAAANASTKPAIGLRPIELAAYLNTKSMIVTQGSNEVIFQDYARWAEPLDAGIERVVRQRLLATGAASTVEMLPSRSPHNYDISLRINACTGYNEPSGANILFIAEYEITGQNGEVLTGLRTYQAPRASWQANNYSDLAAKLGAAAEALADDIAKNLPTK